MNIRYALRRASVLWLLAFLLLSQSAGAQWGDQVERLSESLIWGPFHDVEVQDGLAYCAMGYGLAIFDVSAPSQIQALGVYGVPGSTEGVFVSGNYAYLASGSAGFHILDVSNPASPEFVSGRDSPGYCYELVRGGAFVYLADGEGGLRVISVADINNPQEVASLQLGGWVRNVCLDGDYLYVAAETAGLKIVNIATPSQPQVVGTYNTSGMALGAYQVGNLLYLADGPGGVLIFDVSNPAQPGLLGQWATGGVAHEVEVSGSYAYVANDSPGMVILNVANPALPYLMGQYNSPGLAWSLAIFGTALFLADDDMGLSSVWIANPQAPALLDTYAFPGEVRGIWVSGGYACVARGDLGKITVMNVTNPQLPLQVANYLPPGDLTEVVDVLIQGTTCYSSHLTNGAYFTNMSNPEAPTFIARKNTVGETVGLWPRYPYLYIADSWEGLVVVSLTNLDSAWHINTTGWAKGVVLRSDTAFVSQWDAGIALIDISDPRQPQMLAEYDTPGLAHACALAGGLIFVADDEAGLTILSLLGASVGSYNTAGSAWDVKIAGAFAYIGDAQGGLLILDISDPAHPRYAGSYLTPGVAQKVYLDGANIYVADQTSLGIYRFTGVGVNDPPAVSLPAQFGLSVYPNPFNSVALISLQIPYYQKVDLSIYSLLGQRLTQLYDGALTAGLHRFWWDATEVASGVYIVKMTAGVYSSSQKVVLEK